MENKTKLSLSERVRMFSVGTEIFLFSKAVNVIGYIIGETDFEITKAENYRFKRIREQCFDAAYTGNRDYIKT